MGEINMDLREIHNIGPDTNERILAAAACPALAKHDFILVGFSAARRGFQFQRVAPGMVQLMVCLDGSGEVWLDGSWVACNPGYAYVCPPNAFHSYKKQDDEVWSVCWMQASTEWYERSSAPQHRPTLISIDSGPIVTALEGLLREALDVDSDSAMALWAGLLDIYMSRVLSPEIGDRRLATVFADVGAHPAWGWTLTTLSERAEMSGEQLRRLCLKL